MSKAHSTAAHCSWAQRVLLVPRDSCGDVPAGSDGSCWALCCLNQKQMFSVSEAVATPTAAEGQDSHRGLALKPSWERDFFRTANTEQFPCIQSQLLRHFPWFVSLFNCLNVDISVKLKIPSLSGLNLMLTLWVNVRWTKMSSPKFAEVLNIRNSRALKWRKYFDNLKCSVTHIYDSWQGE